MKWLLLIFLASTTAFLSFRSRPELSPYSFPDISHFPKMPESEENPVTNEGVQLGRFLFYDSILSADRNMSCASCHNQSRAFSDGPKKFSHGNGVNTKRNTPALFNLAWYPSYFWDGRAESIEDLVFHPVRDQNEMNLNWTEAVKRLKKSEFYKPLFSSVFGTKNIDSTNVSKAIGQFLRTLISHESKFDIILRGKDYLSKDEYDGFVLMNDMTKGDCLHCHTTDANPLGTTLTFSNNGLDPVFEIENYTDPGLGGVSGKKEDYGKFKIPSLRNVELTGPYMHDGRFITLEDVLDFYGSGLYKSINVDSKMGFVHQKGNRLTKDEKQKIIAFLKTLTDSSFITNPSFSNPFTKKSN